MIAIKKDADYYNRLAEDALTDEKAFVELYNHFFPRVYRYISYHSGSTDVADELISQIFLSMYKNLDRFDPDKASFSTWLMTITRNRMLTYFRDRKIYVDINEVDDLSAPERDEPEQVALSNERNEELRRAIERLDERDRAMIKMRYWLDLSNIEIAKRLNLTPNYVGVLLNRARARLKVFLTEG